MRGGSELFVRVIAVLSLIFFLVFLNALVKVGVEKFDPCNAVSFEVSEKTQQITNGNIDFDLTVKNNGLKITGFVYQVVNEDQFGIGLASLNSTIKYNESKTFAYSILKQRLNDKPIKYVQLLPILENDLRCAKAKIVVEYG